MRAIGLALVFLTTLALHAEEPAASPAFLTASTVAEAGRTRVIPFRLDPPAATDIRFAATVADPAVLEIVRVPEALAGQALGFLRVRGKAAGRTRLAIGGAVLEVEVVAPRAPANAEAARPRIVNPASGAALWGAFSVGVEVDESTADATRYELRLSNGASVAPSRLGHPARGPGRRLVFALDAASLPPGRLEIVPAAVPDDGVRVEGEAVSVRVLRPGVADVLGFEAEDPGDVERQERFGRERPLVLIHPEASGAEFAVNNGTRPAVCVPVTIREAGRWQMMVRATGSFGGGALPTVALYLDQDPQPITNGVLVDEEWHRIAIGVPIELAVGTHVLTPFFANDFGAGPMADRNLYLDRIELARVEPGGALAGVARLGSGEAPAGAAMGDAAMTGAMGMESAPEGRPAPLRLGVETIVHGLVAPGEFEVRGTCFWLEPQKTPAPRVTLWVNGVARGSQRAAAPRFWIPADALRPGANEIRLVATAADGGTAASPVQTVLRPETRAEVGASDVRAVESTPADTTAEDRPAFFWRFTAHDEGWDAEARKRAGNHRDPPEQKAIGLFSNGRVALALPEGLVGRHQILLEARGDFFEGPPIAKVTLEQGGAAAASVEIEVDDGWNTVEVAPFEFTSGPKRLILAFENDRAVKGVGDRNLIVQAVLLRHLPAGDDVQAPTVRLLYPPDGHALFSADAVVAEAWDDRALASLELVLDGTRTGWKVDLTRACGPAVVPLLARTLSPGRHTIAVRAVDEAGHATLSEERAIDVLAAAPATPGAYARAVRLLNRLAYGPDARELAALLAMGERGWLERRLAGTLDDADEASALGFAEASRPYDRGLRTAGERRLEQALHSPNPVRTRLVQWVDNHFSTWIQKTTDGMEWAEHREFLRLGAAPFADLLLASARSPAMLRYLDQQQSVARRLNENYAREIMELHSVGVHGGYAQADVTALAHLLTGWTFTEEGDGWAPGPLRRRTFRFDPAIHEARALRWFGMSFPRTGPADRYDRAVSAIEMLAAHPSTARFVCRKLAEHYVGAPAPEDLVGDLARVFLERDGDLAAVVLALAEHPRFREEPAREKLCTPLDFALRLARTTGFLRPGPVQEFLQRSAMAPFARPTPDGYPEEDSAYADSNALVQRWRLARRAEGDLTRLVPGRWRRGDEAPTDAWRQSIVDAIAVRLTGGVLGEASNRAAIELLAAAKGGRGEVARLAATFVAQLPEANLR